MKVAAHKIWKRRKKYKGMKLRKSHNLYKRGIGALYELWAPK